MKSKFSWVPVGFRILGSRLIVVVLFALLIVTEHVWIEGGLFDTFLDSVGFILVTVGALGRIWTSVYIAGYKNDKLIDVGPYSMVRNPLYFFSLVAAVGLALSAESLLVAGLMLVAFTLYYPFVILVEEKKLLQVHGDAFREYAAKTPRLIPNIYLFKEPAEYLIKPKKFEKASLDTMWFFWAFGIIQLIESLHEAHVLPVLFKIP